MQKKHLMLSSLQLLMLLKAGDKVSFVGFGTFSVSERAERTGINPSTKATITIPAKKVAKFKAGAELSAAVE